MSKRLTDTELDELAHLEREATPGPWRVFVSRDVDPKTELAALVDGTPGRTADLAYVTADDTDLAPAVTGCGETSEANADFIAAARNTVVRLIAEVRGLRAELNVMQAAAQQVANTNKMLRAELAALKGDREKTREYWELWSARTRVAMYQGDDGEDAESVRRQVHGDKGPDERVVHVTRWRKKR